MARMTRNNIHVGRTGAAIDRRHVATAERINKTSERLKVSLAVFDLRRAYQYRFATALRQTRDGRLVGHTARKAHRID